jgi:pantoate--beta-alanine ligase
MILITTVEEVKQKLQEYISSGKSIGFVPTMGALHEGHISLTKRSVDENEITVVSIFVNPNQFNDKSDLEKYPRTLESDCIELEKVLNENDIVFAPDVQEVYPEDDKRVFDFGNLDKVLEGKYREGHFNGVAQVVSRLFDIVQPSNAYFGKKDFQQLQIIRRMTEMMSFPIHVIGCETIREEDGLAMSSRNQRLNKEDRENALFLYRNLIFAKEKISTLSPMEIKSYVIKNAENNPFVDLEYFELINPATFNPAVEGDKEIVACVAARVGSVRLIDNIKII